MAWEADQEISNENPVRAWVAGQPFLQLPKDLFIPPDALEVVLDSFLGPLDLLLYLIRSQNLDILNIPITAITQQYLEYIQLIKARRLELAVDYLIMAAFLAEIKSRCLLPQKPQTDLPEEEDDPRRILVEKLQRYEQFKTAALHFDQMARCERDIFPFNLEAESIQPIKHYPSVTIENLIEAMQAILQEEKNHKPHIIALEPLSVQEKMAWILEKLSQQSSLLFREIIKYEEGRGGIVVSFLAILELAKESMLHIVQKTLFAEIIMESKSKAL